VGDLLFIGSCAGNFYALNKTTGELKWSYDIRQDGRQVSFHGNPLVINDLILIGTDKSCDPEGIGHVYAFERESGSTAQPASRRTSFNSIQMFTSAVFRTIGLPLIFTLEA
jgi:outer membrane protein assembly factor BamB